MLHVVKNKITKPINLGSGQGYTIGEIAKVISNYYGKEIKWVKSKVTGDKKRLLNLQRAKQTGFEIKTSINDGIIQTINWFENNQKSKTKSILHLDKVLITGATGGLGNFLSKYFVEKGHSLIISSRSNAKLQKIKKGFN